MLRALFLSLLFTFSTSAAAAEVRPKLGVSTGVIWSFKLPSGEGLAPRQALGFATTIPVRGAIVITEVGLTTSFTSFDPAPTFIVGAAKRVKGKFGLGGGVVYALLPPYGGRDLSHLVGASIVPSIKLSDHATLIVPVGPSYNTAAKAWSLTMAAKFIIN